MGSLWMWIALVLITNAGTFALVGYHYHRALLKTGLLPVFKGVLLGGIRDMDVQCSVHEQYYELYRKDMERVARSRMVKITADQTDGKDNERHT